MLRGQVIALSLATVVLDSAQESLFRTSLTPRHRLRILRATRSCGPGYEA